MPRVVFVQADGIRHETVAAAGTNVMQAAVTNLIPGVVAECGGSMSCATCHVFVDSMWWPTVAHRSDGETDMLEVTSEEPTEFSRLSCQIVLTEKLDGIVVHVPATQC